VPSYITLEVGKITHGMEADHLPPVGTILPVHKHLTEDGEYTQIEIVCHEWKLEEGGFDDDGKPSQTPNFHMHIKTRELKS